MKFITHLRELYRESIKQRKSPVSKGGLEAGDKSLAGNRSVNSDKFHKNSSLSTLLDRTNESPREGTGAREHHSPSKANAVQKDRVTIEDLRYQQSFEELFKSLDKREQYILLKRYLIKKPETLRIISRYYGISHERVRQLEERALRDLKKKDLPVVFLNELRKINFPSIMSLEQLSAINKNVGIESGNPLCLIKMIKKMIGFDFHILSKQFVYLKYEGRPNISQVKIDHWKREPRIPKVQFKEYLREKGFKFLTSHEFKILYGYFCEQHQRKTSLRDLTVRSLHAIGRPAHYSDIAEKVRELASGRHSNCSYNSVHATLTTYRDEFVWVGIKGVYGLREWGLSEPNKSLEDQIYDILKQAGRSLSKTDIAVELSKERPYFTESSLSFVLGTSSRIRKDENGLYRTATTDEAEEKKKEWGESNKVSEAIREIFKEWKPQR